jgi:hypothetical protein
MKVRFPPSSCPTTIRVTGLISRGRIVSCVSNLTSVIPDYYISSSLLSWTWQVPHSCPFSSPRFPLSSLSHVSISAHLSRRLPAADSSSYQTHPALAFTITQANRDHIRRAVSPTKKPTYHLSSRNSHNYIILHLVTDNFASG